MTTNGYWMVMRIFDKYPDDGFLFDYLVCSSNLEIERKNPDFWCFSPKPSGLLTFPSKETAEYAAAQFGDIYKNHAVEVNFKLEDEIEDEINEAEQSNT